MGRGLSTAEAAAVLAARYIRRRADAAVVAACVRLIPGGGPDRDLYMRARGGRSGGPPHRILAHVVEVRHAAVGALDMPEGQGRRCKRERD